MSSFLKDGWRFGYWKDIFMVKIPRHWQRMKRKMRRGDSLACAATDEVVEEFKEGPEEWG